MRLHFQAKPWDLFVGMGYTIVMAAVLLAFRVGNLLATLFVLVVPGYVLVAALFPGGDEIDWTERITLSFGLSVAVVPFLGLLLNFTPWGIRLAPIAATICLFTVGVGFIAYRRRMKVPVGRRPSLTVDLVLPAWKAYSVFDKVVVVVLATGIVVAVGTLVYIVVTPPPGERFSEFYILGPGGNTTDYPTNLTLNETGSLIIGVINHESATVNYTVRIDLVGVRIFYNATSGFNETLDVNRTTWSWYNVTLTDDQEWARPYTFRISAMGLWKVQFLLFRDDELSFSYRELHMLVLVTQ